MSINSPSKAVADILQRARTDAAFRAQLLASPTAALSGYTLTSEERALLSDAQAVRSVLGG
jgi:hypothetical protein